MLLSASVLLFCADVAAQTNARAFPTRSKQTYSNRPIDYSVPSPYYGTPMAPRFMTPPVGPAYSRVPRIYTTEHNYTPERDVVAPVVVPTVAEPPAPQQPQVVKETMVVLRDPPPEISVNDELDAFYARLAKIQLEKHQLPEALALVQQIKSEAFKVRTVVGLAEFVSRDVNYRSEAEQLYRLALIGMESLDKKRPFRIDIGNVKVVLPPVGTPLPEEPIVEQPANQGRRPSTIQLMEDDPVEFNPTLSPDDTILRNGNGKLLPPPPPPSDINDAIPSPAPVSTPPAVATPDVSPAAPAETSTTATEHSAKPTYSISLEEDEPEPVAVPQPTEKPQTPAPRSRPRAIVVLPDEN